MNSDKRFLLAAAFSFLILLAYPVYLKWISPETPSKPTQVSPISSETEKIDPSPAAQEMERLVPEKALPEGKSYPFSSNHFQVEFSDRGAVSKLELKSWGKEQKSEVLIDRPPGSSGAFLVSLPNQGISFNAQEFSPSINEAMGEARFIGEEPGKWRLKKTFRFDQDRPAIYLDVEVENLSAQKQPALLEVSSQFAGSTKHDKSPIPAEAFVALRDKLVSEHLDKVQKRPYVVEADILWTALARKYFVLITQPDQPAVLVRTTAGPKGTEWMQSAIQFAPVGVEPGSSLKRSFLIYPGPQYYQTLKSFNQGFEQILSHGFFGLFKLWLLTALQWAHKVTSNYGWAIILLTCAIKLLFTPLTHMSFESMKKMQALQPKIKSLQERYKNDQAKLSQETMGLYKQHKVNPMGGCLPMVLQIPIFIAFYQVLAQTAELKGAPFIFWIKDLSEPDAAWLLPFALPFLGANVNILPLLMLGSMVWQQRLTPQTGGTKEQQQMMMFMPIIFGFIFYNLPSGLVLYWFVNNMLSIFHQLFVKGKALPHHEEV
ncbi:MAG: hypothetical protein A3C35_02075 [Omnitrophica bacterium RIFCSPHIGHO2_02_FULL_46_11]|nr:MAG: hypothetical protein A3C35_02075 [Omnitrophica bacterium RIFCSPHIGHO2_02_FULL_46_11]OGW87445.1 MAG: hypothetical protein A3A81_05710 [Omnitrophica bacterium RIFCSPLOWO2_01_FULL_45_10b]